MTFSIVGFDPNNGDLGVAVQSKFICAGMVVPWAKADVGAIATQAHANTTFGPEGLRLLQSGLSTGEVLAKLISPDEMKEHRQLAIIDKNGQSAAFTGKECFYWAGHIQGENFSCQGNILISEETVESMASVFETTKGDLADKLLAALNAADQEGRGDVRGKQAAGLLVVRDKGGYGGYTDQLINIRVDEHPEPIKELHRVFQIYDMIFLTREDPSNLLKIEGEIATNIKTILSELGYLEGFEILPDFEWNSALSNAFENWMGINNFENKWVENKVWKSVYDYMIKEKGTPMVKLRKMNEL
jgi:uncharacterized Ntn-hydrolase superfamily protein